MDGERLVAVLPGRGQMVAHASDASDDFDAFVLARGEALVRVARGLLRDPHHAEDVVQDVLVKAHQHGGTIITRDTPDAYVRRMLVNAATSFWRRAARREFLLDGSALPAAAGPDESARYDDRQLLLDLLRSLPARQRAVLVLRHYEGMPDAEIAALLGTSVVTVRSNAHRGLAKLRALLENVEESQR